MLVLLVIGQSIARTSGSSLTVLPHSPTSAQHHDNHDDVHQGPEHEEGGSAHQLDDEAAGEGEGGVTDPEHDHHSPDHVGAIRAGHEPLTRSKKFHSTL